MPALTRAEARERSTLIDVTRMEVTLDLDRGAESFDSRVRITFSCTTPGQSTFLDVLPSELRSLVLNGSPVDVSGLRDGRIELTGLKAENVLEADAVMTYSRDGQGLHRAVDPADGEHYVYGHLFLDAAPRVFACFDQPDLKAPYVVTVAAPQGWIVLGNGAATQVGPGRWELARTQPLATYFVTVCAGPYASVRDEHDGIPLGLHARASLREHLEREAPQMLEVTKASFDYYHSLFGIRYPFGEYHQVFVPEFNAGAMENPGCVTFRDTMIFRGAAARDEVLSRTNTITHEMAHMWFGDLVTMRWWDDLWLNESFAEYMSHRTCVDATEFTDAWIDSTMARKAWGYAAERTPSTHPVAGGAALDTQAALQDFDGISYAKGAATLRQLIAHIGDEAFIAGVSAHLREHSFGNGTLADFLGSMERASGRSLAAWSKAWLLTAGLDVISVDPSTGVIDRTVPEQFPADRPHTMDVAGFTDGVEVFRIPVTVTQDRTTVEALREAPSADLVVPNAADLTWATVTLDPASVEAVPTALAAVPDPQARAVVWIALLDGVCLGTVDPRVLVRTFGNAWPAEDNGSVLSRTSLALLSRFIPTFLPPDEQAWAERVVADAAGQLLRSAPLGSTRALVAARTVARSTDDESLLRAWAAGLERPSGLEADSDFGWIAVRNLASRGQVDRGFVEARRAEDDTLQGRLHALSATAALPDREAKAWAWAELTTNRTRSNYELNALAQGFWLAADLDVVRPYVERYFAEVPAMTAWVGEDALARVATLAYPARIVEATTAELSAAAVASGRLSVAVRRSVVDAESELREALRSRATFG
ncbi:aminopeptidase N [Phycicoccus badiiscoriae]|uniref:Aminopeptidase N n=1 Tax=Pedococcus badiiscoriae TaxID=642776 RepID=A0A852WIB9_9MICO|nr:aminopeptidase N [Pedococcus badiiscoriae]NYG06404.1 aminopeptidase N [Pedococcus badiiscoriae]